MAETVADFLLQRLSEWGVRRLYGYPGDGINGILGALDRAKERVQFIQTRHEEMAAFMACAHAKFTGEVGVCVATSGPGAIHLLNGLYDARMDHQPVVAIVGQSARAAIGGEQDRQNIDDARTECAHRLPSPPLASPTRQRLDGHPPGERKVRLESEWGCLVAGKRGTCRC
ncbi:MAG TPA: thiamine pyrophosphate-binding protein [Vicinamibacterales bacterium]|jgi:thiamine pyrophosphate-dependent acetolactate synthase large subunit-like protein